MQQVEGIAGQIWKENSSVTMNISIRYHIRFLIPITKKGNPCKGTTVSKAAHRLLITPKNKLTGGLPVSVI